VREKDYFQRTRIFPIMHLIVVRRDIYEQHPFVATSLFNALCDAKAIAAKKMRYPGTLRYMLPWLAAEIEKMDEVFGADAWAIRRRCQPADAGSADAIYGRTGIDRAGRADRFIVRTDLRAGSQAVTAETS